MDRSTSLVLYGHKTEPFEVEAGVFQGSSLSPILFMLYNFDFFDICRRPYEGLSSIGFADNINILAYRNQPKATAEPSRQCMRNA
jgi:hypothetical protein